MAASSLKRISLGFILSFGVALSTFATTSRIGAPISGHTTLVGGAITSTQAAIDQNRNTFQTAGQSAQQALASGTLTLSDIHNQASYSASSSVNLGTGFSPQGKLTPQGTGAGWGKDSGGSVAGAAVAFNIDANNRQLHPTEIQWIKQNAKRYAQQLDISEADAEKRLAEQAFRQMQFGAEGGAAAWDAQASAFLKQAGQLSLPNGGYMFYATPEQRADATMYLDSAIKNADFYAKNGLTQPTLAELQSAAQRDTALRSKYRVATNTALVASASITLAGLTPTMLSWALSHPVEATTAGVISAETAAAITSGAVTPTSMAPLLSGNAMRTVTTMEAAVSGQAAKATAGGYINAAKVCESGCAITGLSASEQALVAQIQAGKDSGGRLTEQLLESVATRTGATVLSGGKYGGNNGFDLVLKNADGTVTVVMDGKQMLQFGAFSLSANGAGGNTQNSMAWVEAVLENLDKNSAAYKAVFAASRNNTLVTAVGGVNRTTGQLVVLPVTVPAK